MRPFYIVCIVSFGFHFWEMNCLLLKGALLGISIVVKVNIGVSIASVFAFEFESSI